MFVNWFVWVLFWFPGRFTAASASQRCFKLLRLKKSQKPNDANAHLPSSQRFRTWFRRQCDQNTARTGRVSSQSNPFLGQMSTACSSKEAVRSLKLSFSHPPTDLDRLSSIMTGVIFYTLSSRPWVWPPDSFTDSDWPQSSWKSKWLEMGGIGGGGGARSGNVDGTDNFSNQLSTKVHFVL